MSLKGECFCGSIRYAISGSVKDARSCHCSRCRKAFSSQASSYALVDPEAFKWIEGEDLLTTYTGKEGFGLQFCSKCGSTLCGIYNSQVHGISLGCLNGDPGIEIGYHIYTGSKAAWEILPDGITAYPEDAKKI